MATIIVITAIGIFIAGGMAGFILFVSIGVQREERRFSRTGKVGLTRPSPGPVSAAARSVNGVYVRQRSGAGPVRRRPDTVPSGPASGLSLN